VQSKRLLPARATRVAAFSVLAVLFALLAVASPTHAQTAEPGQLPAMDSATRAAVVDSITAAIDSIYVLGEPAKQIVAALKQKLANGDYDEITDPAEFARTLYEDCQAINHDGHFRIFALPPLDPELAAAEQEEDPADIERRRRFERMQNYGFRKVEILPGGVGYVKFNQFAHGDETYQAAAAAMNFVANSNAVIFDLRDADWLSYRTSRLPSERGCGPSRFLWHRRRALQEACRDIENCLPRQNLARFRLVNG
jgi:hypothetical protein